MSKKNKSKQRRQTTARPTSTATFSEATTSRPIKGLSREEVFSPDYSNVIRDLKRIGVLAGSFIFILIILSFFLR